MKMKAKIRPLITHAQQHRRQLFVTTGVVAFFSIAGFLLLAAQHQSGQADPVQAAVAPAEIQTPPITDCSTTPCLALTFDDGPDRDFTPRVLDTLKRHNAHATFFVLGSHVAGKEELLRRMQAEGHEIGNHSWGHPYFTRISPEQRQAEIQSTQDAVIRAGAPAPQLFRPPYGDMNEAMAAEIPLAIIRWNIDPEDWHPRKKQFVPDHLAAYARPGGIVVMHDTEGTTADVLDALITQLEPNYKLVTVSEILGLTPGQRGTYFGRK